MELLVIGDAARVEKYLPELDVVAQLERKVAPRGTPDAKLLALAPDAEVIMADAISPVSAYLIEHMPRLSLIHSEGVAYNAIDLEAARRRGIPVCNCKGVNAGAVAEQAILLMLACLRNLLVGDEAVRQGRQIQVKERMMTEGITELGDCKVGFLGAGDIGQATMTRLGAWGCEMLYHKRRPLDAARERELGARFVPLSEMLATSDIISIHVPVTGETRAMVGTDFLAAMKPGAILINTARGEIVDQEALAAALISGRLAVAGLDTLYPEPVEPDHILLNLPKEASQRLIFSPHVGGITEGTFYRAHRMVWENIARFIAGKPLRNVVS
jgi:phosphoglycerate dehydrogenase-like enzyme